MSDTALGTAFDSCGAEVADVCAVSDTCPMGLSAPLLLTDTCGAAGWKVISLSATMAELSDAASATDAEVPARRARVRRVLHASGCPVEIERVSAAELGQPLPDGGAKLRVGGGDASQESDMVVVESRRARRI